MAGLNLFIALFRVFSFLFVFGYSSLLVVTAVRQKNPRLLFDAFLHAVGHTFEVLFTVVPFILESIDVIIEVIVVLVIISAFIM